MSTSENFSINTSKKFSVKKGFAPIILVLMIALTIGVGTFAFYKYKFKPKPAEPKHNQSVVQNPTPSPTSSLTSTTSLNQTTPNWRTYADTNLAVSFQYPSNWKVIPQYYWLIDISDPNYGGSSCRKDCPAFNIPISVLNNDQNLDLVSFIKKDFNSSTNGLGDFSKIKLENITFTTGLSFTRVTGFAHSYYDLYAMHNNKVYIIGVNAGKGGMLDDINDTLVKQNLEVVDQILSTFKFTN